MMTGTPKMSCSERVDGLMEMGAHKERVIIAKWLRSLDAENGEENHFLPTTLANWIEEKMHHMD